MGNSLILKVCPVYEVVKEHLLPADTSCTGTCEDLPRWHGGASRLDRPLLPPKDNDVNGDEDDGDGDMVVQAA